MKLKMMTLMILGLILGSFSVKAQQETVDVKQPSTLFFHVHEDFVYPSADYAPALEAFKAMAVKYEFETPYTAVWQDNGSYLSVSPVTGLAGVMEQFKDFEKVPDEIVDSVMSKFDGTYERHKDYIARLHLNLSHNPRTATADENYRTWSYHWFEQDKMEVVIDVAKKWKALYESKGIKDGYEIWSPGFGEAGPAIVVIRHAKDAADMAAKEAANREALGEDAKELSEATRKLFYKMDKVEGWILPDYSYMPEAKSVEEAIDDAQDKVDTIEEKLEEADEILEEADEILEEAEDKVDETKDKIKQ